MRVEVSIEIPASPDVVWRTAQDPAMRPRWDGRVCDYQVHGPSQSGTPVSFTVRMGLLRPRVKAVLLRYEPPHQSILKTESTTSSLVPQGAGSWTFTPTETGTRFTSRFTLQAELLPWWINRRLFLLLVELDTRRSMARLRKLVQQQTQ